MTVRRKTRSVVAPPSHRLDRRAAVRQIIGDPDRYLIVAGLAGTKNDVLAATGADCATVFAMGGAMGGAVPMGLGLALAQPQRRVSTVRFRLTRAQVLSTTGIHRTKQNTLLMRGTVLSYIGCIMIIGQNQMFRGKYFSSLNYINQ